jgi:hypothetical protein
MAIWTVLSKAHDYNIKINEMGSGTSSSGEKYSARTQQKQNAVVTLAELAELVAQQANDADDGEVEEADIVSEMKGDRALEALKIADTPEGIKGPLLAIMEIATKNRVNKAMFRKRKAPEVLIKVARERYEATPMVAADCFRALVLVIEGDAKFEDNLGTLGVLEIAVDILQKHATEPDLVELCCCFIRRATSVSVSNAERLGVLECNELIVHVTTAHLSVPTLVTEALHTLTNLCKYAANNTALGECGAAELVVKAMETHPTETPVITAGGRAIVNLAANTVNNYKLGQAGACQVIAAALRDLSSSAEVADVCVRAVINLSSDSLNRKLLGESGGCEALVEVIRKYPTNNTILYGGCQACSNLSNVVTNRDKLSTLGLKAVLINVLISPDFSGTTDTFHTFTSPAHCVYIPSDLPPCLYITHPFLFT